MTLVEASEIIRNVALTAAAPMGAVIALRGLNSWQREKTWETDAELARRLLIAIYKYRTSLFAIRKPRFLPEELRLTQEEESEIKGETYYGKDLIGAYIRRWEKHEEQWVALDALLIEADALWGGELRNMIKKLRELDKELLDYVSLFLESYHRKNDPKTTARFREDLRKKRYIQFESENSDTDVFRVDFLNAMNPIEDFLRAKLRQNPQ